MPSDENLPQAEAQPETTEDAARLTDESLPDLITGHLVGLYSSKSRVDSNSSASAPIGGPVLF